MCMDIHVNMYVCAYIYTHTTTLLSSGHVITVPLRMYVATYVCMCIPM